MISDVANWVLINVLTNTRVFTSLLALIILIVAGFLISDKKPAKKVPSKRILGAVLFVFATFVFLHANIADLADVFTVWATLVLAGVAIFSFEESRHLREENRQRDERERKERLLNEIIEWATDIVQCETSAPLTPFPAMELAKSAKELGKQMAEVIFETRDRNIRTNLIMRYQSLGIMRERIVLIAKKLDKQFSCSLECLAQETAKKLNAHVDLGQKFIDREVTDEEYKKHWQSLVDSANSLAEEAEKTAD